MDRLLHAIFRYRASSNPRLDNAYISLRCIDATRLPKTTARRRGDNDLTENVEARTQPLVNDEVRFQTVRFNAPGEVEQRVQMCEPQRWTSRRDAPIAMDSSFSLHLRKLHESVLAGDPRAMEGVAESLLRRCERIVKRRLPLLDADAAADVVEDALLRYMKQPTRYDPGLARLDTFIVRDATYLALHVLRSQRLRNLRHPQLTERMQACYCSRYSHCADASEDIGLASASALPSLINRVSTGRERAFLLAKARGERRTSVLAAILGCQVSAPIEQRRIVKQVSDKLVARLRRLAVGVRKRRPAEAKTNCVR